MRENRRAALACPAEGGWAHVIIAMAGGAVPHWLCMVSPARAAAFDILLRVEQQHAYAGELLHSSRLDKLSPADRGLCTELVMGVLRWQSRLDYEIGGVSSQPLRKLDPEVLIALRLAAYQIRFLDRIPARAAVNESVELAKRARKRFAAPFVNAVLRKLAPAETKPTPAPGPRAAMDLAQEYAHPQWLVERWVAAYGAEAAEKVCEYDQAVPETAVRLPHNATKEEGQSTELTPGRLLASARRFKPGSQPPPLPAQDEASQLVALLAGNGRRILDCCAAPGGKTAILAERNPEAMIVAADLHPHRARLMQRLLPKQTRIHVIAADAIHLPLAGDFDLILVDVPCSGTGTLARNPEIKWRLQAADLGDLHARQVAIIKAVLEKASPGGRVVYSTCSLEREENAAVVEEALTARKDFRVVECRSELEKLRASGELAWHDLDSLIAGPYLRTTPGVHPCDGFFAAILEQE